MPEIDTAAFVKITSVCQHLIDVDLAVLDICNDAVTAIVQRNRRIKRLSLRSKNVSLEGLTDLPDLESLSIGVSTGLTDMTLARVVSGCPKLLELELVCKLVGDETMLALARSPCPLRKLRVFGCVTDAGASTAVLAHQGTLESVNLNGGLGNRTALAVACCTRLREVEIADCNTTVTDAGALAIVRSCPELRSFVLGGQAKHGVENPDAIIRALSAARHLESVSVSAFEMGCDRILPALAELARKCPALTSIDVIFIDLVHDEMLALVLAAPNLTHLGLCDVGGVIDQDVDVIAAHCPLLKSLVFLNCDMADVLEATWHKVAQRCPLLERLCGGERLWITDAIVEVLATSCALTDLDLSDADMLTDASLAMLGTCTKLNCLRLGSNRFTDVGVASLAALPVLSELVLSSNQIVVCFPLPCNLCELNLEDTCVTDEGVARLASLPRLSSLHLPVETVSEAAVERLIAARPRLTVWYKHR